ncbi:MAG: hypothetical protein FJ039_04315 [Chloroflexi bacterium]|nr:hypothetical protein [Chloroflexota bacterium]
MRPPDINHVALTVERRILTGEGREELKHFLGEVFGWKPLDYLTIDGKRLVFHLYQMTQLLYLVSGPTPAIAPSGDHFGIRVYERETIDKMAASARAFKKTHPNLTVTPVRRFTDTPRVTGWSTYIRYLLPLTIEVQYFIEKAGAASTYTAWAKRG